MANAIAISENIVEALLSRRLPPGTRLGEQDLAALFSCSRTIVREALTRLTARGLVTVSARRGWYVADMDRKAAKAVFDARRIIETSILRHSAPLDETAIRRLQAHIDRQDKAVASGDIQARSVLLGDFHVCLAECAGNAVLAEIVRDLTVRTTLAAMRFQSGDDAARSLAEHRTIVDALARGDVAGAEEAMARHLGTWFAKLPVPGRAGERERLRDALRLPGDPA